MERDRLRRLAHDVPLTVLRAPSGFGKTVAVTPWLRAPTGPAGPAIWLRIYSGLNAAPFWTELAGLLTEAGVSVRRTDGPTHRDIETSVRKFATPLTIVVDGYGALSDTPTERHLTDVARYSRNLRDVVCLRSSRHFPDSLPAEVDTALIESLRNAVTPIQLTDRERRVLHRIAEGGTLQEIAAELFVSANTVKSQVRSLYSNLGAHLRSTALTSAARHDLLINPPAASDC